MTVEFTQTEFQVREDEGLARVCLSLDMPIATPITVYIEAVESTPRYASGKSCMRCHIVNCAS